MNQDHFKDCSSEELNDVALRFTEQANQFIIDHGNEGIELLKTMDQPTSMDLRSPHFSLSAFYTRSQSGEDLDVFDSNDLTTDGGHSMIQHRNNLTGDLNSTIHKEQSNYADLSVSAIGHILQKQPDAAEDSQEMESENFGSDFEISKSMIRNELRSDELDTNGLTSYHINLGPKTRLDAAYTSVNSDTDVNEEADR